MRIEGPEGIVEVTLGGVEILPDGSIRTPDGVFHVAIAKDGDAVWVSYAGVAARFARPSVRVQRVENEVRAPMTGRVVKVDVAPGDAVKAGAVVAVLEAMKMELRMEAPRDGVVRTVEVIAGQLVELGSLVVTLS
ncbi:MAG: biotin/lipoyl-containing protein [bacterium]